MPRPIVKDHIKFCHCTAVRVHCRVCGALDARVDVEGPMTLLRVKQVQQFILQAHNEVMHPYGTENL